MPIFVKQVSFSVGYFSLVICKVIVPLSNAFPLPPPTVRKPVPVFLMALENLFKSEDPEPDEKVSNSSAIYGDVLGQFNYREVII